jgi:putative ABC transport system permease protein
MAASKALVRMAQRSVRRNWRHSLGTLLAIAVGFVAIGLFEGYLADLTRAQADALSKQGMFGDLLIERTGASSSAGREDPWAFHLGPDEQRFIDAYLAAHAREVRVRARGLEVSGLASTGKVGALFLGWGFDVAEGATLREQFAWNALAGRPLQLAGPQAVLLAQGLGRTLDCAAPVDAKTTGPDGRLLAEARPFKCRRGRAQLTATTASGQLNVVELEVAGLYSAGLQELDARLAQLPLAQAQRLLDTTDVSRVVVGLAPGVDAASFAQALSGAAAAQGLAVTATRWQDHEVGELYRRSLDLVGVFRSFVVLVVVSIAAMSVLMTMMKAVSERTREIGTLRSLGFLRRHVVALFVLEAGLLAGLASVAGACATLVLTVAVNHLGLTYKAGILANAIPLAVRVVPGAYVFAVLFLSSVAMVAAVVPARRAARMVIPEALGHV